MSSYLSTWILIKWGNSSQLHHAILFLFLFYFFINQTKTNSNKSIEATTCTFGRMEERQSVRTFTTFFPHPHTTWLLLRKMNTNQGCVPKNNSQRYANPLIKFQDLGSWWEGIPELFGFRGRGWSSFISTRYHHVFKLQGAACVLTIPRNSVGLWAMYPQQSYLSPIRKIIISQLQEQILDKSQNAN